MYQLNCDPGVNNPNGAGGRMNETHKIVIDYNSQICRLPALVWVSLFLQSQFMSGVRGSVNRLPLFLLVSVLSQHSLYPLP